MARTLTPERQILKEWAIILAGMRMTERNIAKLLKQPKTTVHGWLFGENIPDQVAFILDQNGEIVHNSGVVVGNFHDGLPSNPVPQFFVGRAEDMSFLRDGTVDIIITSPPYNLGREKWPMGGNGRTPREAGIGYSEHKDNMPEDEYEEWQILCLKECYRVAKLGASMFYNHKVRQKLGGIIHPISWLQHTTPWDLRQEIIWDRLSTHNHTATLFWPQDERIYWLTKGNPNLLNKSINLPSVWREFGPIPKNGGHPAPFTPALPKMILKAVEKPGDTILDPFAGSGSTAFAGSNFDHRKYILVEPDPQYAGLIRGRAKEEFNWEVIAYE